MCYNNNCDTCYYYDRCHCRTCGCEPKLRPEKCFSILSVTPGSTTSTLTFDRLIVDLPQNGPFTLKIMQSQLTRNNTSNIVFTDVTGSPVLPGMIENGNALRNDSLYEYCCEHADCHGVVILEAYRGNDAPTIGGHISIINCDMPESSFPAAEIAPPEDIVMATPTKSAKS